MEQTFKPSAQALRSRQAGPSPPHARTDELPATQAPRLSSTLQWELPCPNQNSNSVRTLTLMPYFMPYSMPSFWYPLQAYRWTRIPSRTQMSDQLMDDVSDLTVAVLIMHLLLCRNSSTQATQARYNSQTQARYHSQRLRQAAVSGTSSTKHISSQAEAIDLVCILSCTHLFVF